MTEYHILDAFGIDNGELDGVDSQRSFVLGAEYGGFRSRMERVAVGRDGSAMGQVHTDNLDRIRAVASRLNLCISVRWVNDDWADVKVVKL